MRADTDRIAEDLDAIIADCRAMKNQLPDLDLLAYEKRTGGDDVHVKSSREAYYLDTIGEFDAKRALRNVKRTAGKVREQLHSARVGVFALFAGPGAEEMRGTTISRKTFEEAKAAQDRRREAPNDYVPVAVEAQPKYPKAGR